MRKAWLWFNSLPARGRPARFLRRATLLVATALLLLRPSGAAAGPVSIVVTPAAGDVGQFSQVLARAAALPVTVAKPGPDLRIDPAFTVLGTVSGAVSPGVSSTVSVSISRVSEPRTLPVFAVGLAGLLLLRFRRGRRARPAVAAPF